VKLFTWCVTGKVPGATRSFRGLASTMSQVPCGHAIAFEPVELV
jgi:hypothetical protein